MLLLQMSCLQSVYVYVCMQRGQAQAKLAIADQDGPNICIYDARGGSSEPLAVVQPHRAPVLAMRFNSRHDTVISVDNKGQRLLKHAAPHQMLHITFRCGVRLYVCAHCKM